MTTDTTRKPITRRSSRRRARILTVVLVIVAICFIAYVVWCRANHHYANQCSANIQVLQQANAALLAEKQSLEEQLANQACFVCNKAKDDCECAAYIQSLHQENAALQVENQSLEEQLALEKQNHSANTGICYGECSVCCPDTEQCAHPRTYWVSGDEIVTEIGTKYLCCTYEQFEYKVCIECDEILDSRQAYYDEDTTHEYSGNQCVDCDYTKPAKPTAAPTQAPTTAPTECPHASKTISSYPYWVKVGTENTCMKEVKVVTEKCSSCGEIWSTTEETGAVTTVHSYKGKVCTECRFERQVQSGSATVGGTIDSGNTSGSHQDSGTSGVPN